MSKVWGIRHIRYWVLRTRFNIFLERCQAMGFGWIPQQSDLDYLDKVWRGER